MFTRDDIRDFVRTRTEDRDAVTLPPQVLGGVLPPADELRDDEELQDEVGALPAELSRPPRQRFSIVMPSFNHARFIERSLNSVLNQGVPNIELIVMDGGSKDGTLDVLSRYGEDIAFWRSEPDQGQSDALNKGFRRATGDIFGWLNSDDLYLPGAFAQVAELFEQHPDVDVVYGDWYSVDVDDGIVERHLGLASSRGRLVTEGFFCNAQAMFWRRRLHERYGEFDLRLHYTMDYDLMLRLISIAGSRAFLRTDRPLGCFRVYPGQKTGSSVHKVAQEHRHIAGREHTSWKYAARGRLLRQMFRVKRLAEYWMRRGPGYTVRKMRRSTPPTETPLESLGPHPPQPPAVRE